MPITIKNDTTEALIRELAKVTGESQVGAITEAVRERLARFRGARDVDRIDELVAAFQEAAAGHELDSEFLWDERGMPA